MKQINKALVVITCFALSSVDAKQVGKKTITNEPAPSPYIQPSPRQIPVIQPQQKGPQRGYTQILNQLQTMKPAHDDWDVLRDIKYEVEKQMNTIYDPHLAKKPAPKPSNKPATKFEQSAQMITFAYGLVDKYQIPLKATNQQIRLAQQKDTDIFSEKEQTEQYKAVGIILTQFIEGYPQTNKDDTISIIFKAINAHPTYSSLSLQIKNALGDENGQRMMEEINKDLKKIITQAWDDLH